MKILCIADKIDPLIYSNAIKTRYKDIDLILSAGDLNLEYYAYIVTHLNKPLIFVFGNHNLSKMGNFTKNNDYPDTELFTAESESYGSIWAGGKIVRKKGLLIAGAGGCRKYNGKKNQFTERQMYFYLFKMIPSLIWNKIIHGRFIDIFLTHTPPYGIHDNTDVCHTGFKSFLWFNRVFKPAYHIHGHIHLYDLNKKRKSVFMKTEIINAYKHIEIDVKSSILNAGNH